MKNLFVTFARIFLPVGLSCGCFLHAEKAPPPAVDDELLEALGQAVASDSIVKRLALSDAELVSFLKGFRKGAKDEADQARIQALLPRIQTFVKGRMAIAQAKERELQKARLGTLRMPMDLAIETSAGDKTTLAKLATGKKAVLLDFWASWCGPCMRLMPELSKKAVAYGPKGIVVAGMNTENRARAEKVRKERGITFGWLVEPEGRPFSNLLGIDSIPRMVLVSPKGKILFNGHPMDEGLTVALAELGVK